jgi:hypothetical protein
LVSVIITTELVDITVPTKSSCGEKYLDKDTKYYNLGHYEYIMGEVKKGVRFTPYSLYDLRILRGEKKMREVK